MTDPMTPTPDPDERVSNVPALGTPERDWWHRGAIAEAGLRDAPRKAAPEKVRELMDYLDAVIKHQKRDATTPGRLLANGVCVFSSTLSRVEKRRIRRALRGKR